MSWSQGPDLLPLDLEDLEDVNFDVGFEDLINTDALLDGALSLPVALTPKPDQMLVPSRHHPQTSLEEMIASRIQYALDVIKKVPSSMVSENQTPWSHPYLYRAYMPREMQGMSLRGWSWSITNNILARCTSVLCFVCCEEPIQRRHDPAYYSGQGT